MTQNPNSLDHVEADDIRGPPFKLTWDEAKLLGIAGVCVSCSPTFRHLTKLQVGFFLDGELNSYQQKHTLTFTAVKLMTFLSSM